MHKLYPEIAKLLHYLHYNMPKNIINQVKLSLGFKNWIDFLKSFILEHLNKLYNYQIISLNEITYYNNLFNKLIFKYLLILKKSQISILKGDILPQNFLVSDEEDKILGLVDWDFVKIGDPAFEMCSFQDIYLKTYIKIAKKTNMYFNEKEFRFKLKIYYPILNLAIICSMCKKNSDTVWLRQSFHERITSNLQKLL